MTQIWARLTAPKGLGIFSVKHPVK